MNGHKNRSHWNVSLWIHNDEGLYRMAQEHVRRASTRDEAAQAFVEHLNDMGVTETPDGSRYTKTSVRAALVGI